MSLFNVHSWIYTALTRGVELLLPILLLVAVPTGVLISVVIGRPSLGIVGFATVGPPFLAVGALIYTFKRQGDRSLKEIGYHIHDIQTQRRVNKVQWICFGGLFTLGFQVLSTPTPRPPWYFLAAAGLYLAVAFRIWFLQDRVSVLVQTAIVFLLSVYTVTIKYPFFIGSSDILPHLQFAQYVVRNGTIMPSSLTISYSSFPLFHVTIAMLSKLFGASIKSSWELVSPIVFCSSIPVVYEIGRRTVGDEKISLLAALTFVTLPTVVTYGQYFITRTAAAVAFFFVVYLLFRRSNRLRIVVPLAIFGAYVLLVHQVSAPQIVSLLLILALVTKEPSLVRKKLVIFTVLLAIAVELYWAFAATEFTTTLVVTRIEGILEPAATTTRSASGGGLNHPNFYSHVYVSTLFVLLGLWSLVTESPKKLGASIGGFLFFTMLLYVPNPLTAFWITQYLFRIDRYYLLLSPFIAVGTAFGFVTLVNRSRRSVFNYGAGVLFVVFVLTSVWAGNVAPVASDAQDLEWTGPPKYLSESELQGLEFVHERAISGSDLHGDRATERYLNEYRQPTPRAEGQQPPVDSLRTTNVTEIDGTVVLRTYRFSHGGVTVGPAEYRYRIDEQVAPEFPGRLARSKSQVYDSGGVHLYVPTNGTTNETTTNSSYRETVRFGRSTNFETSAAWSLGCMPSTSNRIDPRSRARFTSYPTSS